MRSLAHDPLYDTWAVPLELERHPLIHLVAPYGVRLLSSSVAIDRCMAPRLAVYLQLWAHVGLLGLAIKNGTSVLAQLVKVL